MTKNQVFRIGKLVYRDPCFLLNYQAGEPLYQLRKVKILGQQKSTFISYKR
ncbi:hypothetical protein ES705_09899 [subsurface metagenome]